MVSLTDGLIIVELRIVKKKNKISVFVATTYGSLFSLKWTLQLVAAHMKPILGCDYSD